MSLVKRKSSAIELALGLIEEMESIANSLSDDESTINEAAGNLQELVDTLQNEEYDNVVTFATHWNNPEYDISFDMKTASSRGIKDLDGIEIKLSDIAQEFIDLLEEDDE